MTSFYNGKTIWLVGASEGIGAAFAHKLAASGASVIVSARSQDKISALVASLSGTGHLAIPVDVTSLESVTAAWQQITAQKAQVDMVLYNAGAYEPMGADRFNLTQIERMVDVNLSGVFRVLSLAVPYFISRNTGHIVLVGSVAGYRGLPDAIGYGASKAAVNHLAENLRVDLPSSIKVQLVCPGFVKTQLTDKNDFKMPFIITAEQAADYMMKGLEKNCFEIHFPKRFSLILKTLSLLPSCCYFPIAKKMKG